MRRNFKKKNMLCALGLALSLSTLTGCRDTQRFCCDNEVTLEKIEDESITSGKFISLNNLIISKNGGDFGIRYQDKIGLACDLDDNGAVEQFYFTNLSSLDVAKEIMNWDYSDVGIYPYFMAYSMGNGNYYIECLPIEGKIPMGITKKEDSNHNIYGAGYVSKDLATEIFSQYLYAYFTPVAMDESLQKDFNKALTRKK